MIILLIIKPTRSTNISNLFLKWNSTCFGQFLCPSSGVFHCTHSNGTCHTGLLTACEQEQMFFILEMKLYMFWTVPLSIIRSFSLYTQQWYMSYRFADSLQATANVPAQSANLYDLLPCVQWKTPDDGQRNCPKHVEFHFKNKFEILVHLVGFNIRNLSRCTVTWTSNDKISCAWLKWTYKQYTLRHQ